MKKGTKILLKTLVGIGGVSTLVIFHKTIRTILSERSYEEDLKRMGLMRLKTVQEKIKFLEDEIEYLGGYTYSFSFKSFFSDLELYFKKGFIVDILENLDSKKRELKLIDPAEEAKK
jgi:hypothetical protein